jgi:hypothetical protein
MRSKFTRLHHDLRFLNENGMVACNPRDREAAHRAVAEGIATSGAPPLVLF